MSKLDCFDQIWLVDFEFQQDEGKRPVSLCLVGREFRTKKLIRLWRDEMLSLDRPLYGVSNKSLFVAYYASAEIGCHLSLKWSVPVRILDLYAEFRCLTSGLPVPCGRGLLGALAYYGLGGIEVAEKEAMRELALRGGDYTFDERKALLDYCQSDVDALARLLPAMLPQIDLPRALLRGRYMAAAARIEWTGTPIDTELLEVLRNNHEVIQEHLISVVNSEYGVYEGRTFKADRFAKYLCKQDIPWPCLSSGSLALDDETFKTMSRAYPQLQPLRQLRKTIAELRLNKLSVGSGGYNRCLLSCYATKTGRNAPSNSRFVFGLPKWSRCLIKPKHETAIAYIDYEQQEFGIAAALSGDKAMMQAYESGDPYLALAKQAGAAPEEATKATHPDTREQFKVCSLGVQYGMGERSLAQSLGIPVAQARQLLELHRETYPTFWKWFEAVLNHAMLTNSIHTVFGWCLHVGENVNPRSVTNFPMQANGAEILRLACCEMTEQGIAVCAPVHDAILVEGSTDKINEVVANAERAMREASEIVLDGFPLRTEVEIFCYPDRYIDKRGTEMWNIVRKVLDELGVGLRWYR